MTTQAQLVKSLKRIQEKLCAYTKQPCDCKFMNDSDEFICRGSENGSGCPELFMAIGLIESMTPAEFARISKRAGLSHHFDDIEARFGNVKPQSKKRKIKAKKPTPLPFLDKQAMDKMVEQFTETFVQAIINSAPKK